MAPRTRSQTLKAREQRISLSSLPLEIYQIITKHIDDLDSLIAWAHTCSKSRKASGAYVGEQTFLRLLREKVPSYWDSALIASRVQFLDLQEEDWVREIGKPWQFRGKEVNEDWFRELLDWTAKDVYLPEERDAIPWLFEYYAMQASHKFPMSFIAAREEDELFKYFVPFSFMLENNEWINRYFAGYYRIQTWTLLHAETIYQLIPKFTSTSQWPWTEEYGEAYEKTKASWSGFLDYVMSTAAETDKLSKRDNELLLMGCMWSTIEILNSRVRQYVETINKSRPLPWSTYKDRRAKQREALKQRPFSRKAYLFFDSPFTAERAALSGDVFGNTSDLIKEQAEKGKNSLKIVPINPQKGLNSQAREWWTLFIEKYLVDKYRLQMAFGMTREWSDFMLEGGFLETHDMKYFFWDIDDPAEQARNH